ncbi:MAG TPA: FAD-binding protein [Candidatus Saccharimonadaceae bacterium]|nr:FAD-binding protein [Candidatus Saccharimonadaceae bacterium]
MTDSFLEKTIGQPLDAFRKLAPDQRAGAVRESIPDLHYFFDEGAALGKRQAPARSRELAQALHAALSAEPDADAGTLRERIVTDALLRGEADRDQNVYLGPLFTRTLTQAVPDLVFQPASLGECAKALRWARDAKVPVTLRGAASTAMGGAVPNDAGLTLDLSRLDFVDIEPGAGVAVVGAGARMRNVHAKLAARGFALRAYPSNLGGTLVGWFVTGGIGMNAYGRGRALDTVRTADVLLPNGEHVRFHDDGRLDVPDEGHKRRTLASDESALWFSARGLQPMTLADLAGSEGVMGLVLHVAVAIEPRPAIGAFLLSFDAEADALAAVEWVGGGGAGGGDAAAQDRDAARPANVKLFSASHMHHTRRVWQDEAAREWRAQPSALSNASQLPWTRIVGPAELGATTSADTEHAGAYLFVDFLDLDAARAFAARLAECPGHPRVLGEDGVRFAGERFRPQQTKRLGPGLLAAEIVMPGAEVARFLPAAARLARNAGCELDAEVYFLADGCALVIGGYLTDHRTGAFALDLVLAPALVDLAMNGFHGKPYVLGRWQSAWLARQVGAAEARRVADMKRSLDPDAVLNRGVRLGLLLKGPLGALLGATFAPGIGFVRGVYASPLSLVVRALRGPLGAFAGPARGRGEPATIGATFQVAPLEGAAANPAPSAQRASARALNCVNCGECNTVCPIFNESKIRLPQMLTHVGEAMHAGQPIGAAGATLLDLCMRCGNCEEVCQAGIPHLPLYEAMQAAAEREAPEREERHVAVLAALRGSPRYTREFLDIRPGGYLKRTPASLAGTSRYVLLRAEGDAGPAAACIHCGACVAVCPTGANHEFEGADPRWITTEQAACIGCGTCVEVCPANLANGGQTLRVMEAPTQAWFIAIEEFEKGRTR